MKTTWIERLRPTGGAHRYRVKAACWAVFLAALLGGPIAQAAALPTVTEVVPNEGSTAGGAEVTVSGTKLEAGATVLFGTVSAKFVKYVPNKITVTSPAHVTGTVDVTVKTREGTSSKVSADQYTYWTTPPPPPTNLTLPVASPEIPHQAAAETASPGTWTGKPYAFKYQWERCVSTSECEAIPSATQATYYPHYKDVGKRLAVVVTAENGGGHGVATSATTQPVVPNGVTEYPSGDSSLQGITTGPDGNLWFVAGGGETFEFEPYGRVGKITTSGAVTQYLLPKGSQPKSIVAGADGDLWVTEWNASKIAKITTAGAITEYALPAFSEPQGIAAGPDGSLWFTEEANGTGGGRIGKITTAGVVSEYALSAESKPHEIAAGPDGNLWFTISYGKTGTADRIGKITTAGAITEYSLSACEGTSASPWGITAGPDGNLWVTLQCGAKIGKITTSGVSTYYSSGGTFPYYITAGPDGNLWFTEWGSTSEVYKMTTAGALTEYALPPGTDPYGITTGPDHNIWFTAGREIGKIKP